MILVSVTAFVFLKNQSPITSPISEPEPIPVEENVVDTNTDTDPNPFKDEAYIENKLKRENWGIKFSDDPIGYVEEHAEYNTYINNIWGFKFNYPKDWILKEPGFMNNASLFTLNINPQPPLYPDTIYLNITEKEWTDEIIGELNEIPQHSVKATTFKKNQPSLKPV